VGKPKRTKTADDRECLSFTWQGCRFVCMPYQGVALPAPEGTERLTQPPRRYAGRLVLLAHLIDAPASAISVRDHYRFADGSWSAYGVEHVVHTDLRAKGISRYALRLLFRLDSQFDLFWRPSNQLEPGDTNGSGRRLAMHSDAAND
jgi:hypothetical protein